MYTWNKIVKVHKKMSLNLTAETFSLFNHYQDSIEFFTNTVTSSRFKNQPTSNIPNNYLQRFGRIKFISCRELTCFVVSEDDEVFSLDKNRNWKYYKIGFKFPNERIVNISVSYHACVLVLQSVSGGGAGSTGGMNLIRTRVFVCYSANRNELGVRKTKFAERVETFSQSGIENSEIEWTCLEDFQLQDGEFITKTSCAAFTCCFLTSHGRLLACGSNQFFEIAQPSSDNNIPAIQCCCLDPSNECKEPFFTKTVNGDHNIIALTRDHNIFYCGYSMGNNGNNLPMMKQLAPISLMGEDEYFIDICASYYSWIYLTSKYI